MKHATATSKRVREKERETKRRKTFIIKELHTHTDTYSNTHNIEGQGARRVIEEKRHMRK